MIAYILIFLIVAFMFWKWYSQSNNKKINITPILKKLMVQASEWVTSAKENSNPIISLMHANYAAGYLLAIKNLAKSNDINKILPNFAKYDEDITNVQELATNNLMKFCPSINPE
jgi:hypothetical protein